MTFKSGFVAILGRPNVGKSTFLNHVMGQKIAIMSDKAQTTRNKIMGIYTTDKEQIVFIDTPGIHKPKTALGDFMVESAYSTLREVDTVLFMVPADEPRGKGDNMIIERLKAAKVPVILVVNKIDKVHPARALLLKRLRGLDGVFRHLLRRGVIALEQADAFAVLEVNRR